MDIIIVKAVSSIRNMRASDIVVCKDVSSIIANSGSTWTVTRWARDTRRIGEWDRIDSWHTSYSSAINALRDKQRTARWIGCWSVIEMLENCIRQLEVEQAASRTIVVHERPADTIVVERRPRTWLDVLGDVVEAACEPPRRDYEVVHHI